MKNMARSKGLAVVMSAVFFVFTCVSVPHAGFVPKTGWEAQIRPGVMGGDGDTQTDYFIDILLPFWGNENALLFLNPNYRFDDENEREWNIGIGTRLLCMDDALILGGNAYFDTMETDYDNQYQQWGLGLEGMSKWVDFRANYYNPYGDTKERMVGLDKYSFASTSILVNEGWEEALKGYDAEIGFLVPFISDYFETRVYGGYYWYDSEVTDDIDGTRFRVELRPMPLLNLNMEVKDDDIRTTTFVGGYLSIPFSFEELFSGSNPFKGIGDALAFGKGARSVTERMTDKVVRDRHIQTEALVADDPDTVIEEIVYVNADNAPNRGDGTYEKPYKHIRLFDENDPRWKKGMWIYVFSWDDEGDQQDDVDFTLLDRMVLWGEGYAHPMFAYQLGGGPYPILDGGEGDQVITLAVRNEIMGLTVQNAQHGIYGEKIRSTYIHDNIIRDNLGAGSGIHIEGDFTPDTASDMHYLYTIANNQLLDNAGYGAYLSTSLTSDSITDSSITSVFSDNTVKRNEAGGLYVRSVMTADNATPGSDLVASVSDSSISNTFSGNDISANEGTGVYLARTIMANAEAYESVEGSVVASVTGSSIDTTFADNSIKDNKGFGVFMEDGGGPSNLKAYAYVEGPDVDVTGDVSATVTDSSLNNLFTDNEISDNHSSGVYTASGMGVSAVASASTVEGSISASLIGSGISNTFTENDISSNESEEDTGDGVNMNNEVRVVASVTDAPLTVTGNVTASSEGTFVDSTFTNNTMNENYDDGVELENTMVTSADVNGSTVGGSVVASVSATTMGNTFTGNDISENFGDGVEMPEINHIIAYVEVENGSSVDGGVATSVADAAIANTFSGNTINYNDSDGVAINYNNIEAYAYLNNSSITGSVTADTARAAISNGFNGNDTSYNGDEGIDLDDDNEIFADVIVVNGSSVDGEGGVATSVADAAITNTFIHNTVNFNLDDGVETEYNEIETYAYVDSSSVTGSVTADTTRAAINNTVINNTVNDNTEDGIDFDGDNEIFADVNVSNSPGSVGGNVTASVSDAAIANTFTENEVSSNGGTGVDMGDSEIGADAYVNNGSIAGSVTADTTGATITNTFTENEVSSNDDSGIHIENNEISAYVDVYNGSSVGGVGGVGASVADAAIANTFTENNVSSNGGTGIYIETNSLDASAYVIDSPASIAGNVTASVTDSAIANTFTENNVSSNDGTGVYIGWYDWGGDWEAHPGNRVYAGIGVYDSSITGYVAGEVANTTVTNTFTNNTINNNEWGGVDVDNTIDSTVWNFGDLGGTIGGSLTASMDNVAITNTLTGNTTDGNGADGDGEGVDLANTIDTSAFNYNDTVNGSVSASVDNAAITNTLTGHSASNNDDDGVQVDNTVESTAWTVSDGVLLSVGGKVTASVDRITVTNVFTGGTAQNNEYEGVDFDTTVETSVLNYNDTVNGVLRASVGETSVTNIITDNAISENEADGVEVGNTVESSAWTFGDGGGETVGRSVSASVSTTDITNTIANNTINNSGDEDAGVDLDNTIQTSVLNANDSISRNLMASVDSSSITNTLTDNTISRSGDDGVEVTNTVESTAWNMGDGGIVGENVAAVIGNLDISNTFTNNTINNNEDDGVEVDNAIHATARNGWPGPPLFISGGVVGGNITAMVETASITNTFTNNTINENGYEGVDMDNTVSSSAFTSAAVGTVDGNVTTMVDTTTVTNTFTDNDVSGNLENGIDMYNWLGARNYVYDAVGGNVAAKVTDSAIANTFSGNTINENDGAGVYVYNEVDACSSCHGGSLITGDLTADITSTTITNTFTGNDVSSNGAGETGIDLYNMMNADAGYDMGPSDVGGNLAAAVTDSAIANTFTGNTINYNQGDGVELDNLVESDASTNGGSVDGDITADISNTDVTNTFTDNDISGNDQAGIDLYNHMLVYSDGDPATITDSGISDTFTNNTVEDNQGSPATGIDIFYEIITDVMAGDVTVDLFMQGNSVVNNQGTGVYVRYNGPAGVFTGDLGGGALGSVGNNSFYGSELFDLHLFSDTDTLITAENNWWGDDDPSDQVETEGAGTNAIDYDPWLSSAP